jgi:site-specific recombinase XerD
VVDGVLQFRQKKRSKKFNYLPLSKQAQSILSGLDKNELDDRIFLKLPTPAQSATKYLQLWAKNAGISKHITWHVARHTYATVLLNVGVDLFTISKLLGHYSESTTQIYGKVMTKTKLDAIEKFPAIF